MTDLLTPEQAATALGVPRSSLMKLVRGRALGVVLLGPRTFRFRRDDLDAYISAAYREPRHDEEAPRERQRRRLDLQSPRTQAPVVRDRHDRLDARRAPGPPQPLRRVEG